MQLSKSLSLETFQHSNKATELGIGNTLPPALLTDAIRLATKLFEPIRELLNTPLLVTSGYRCIEVNNAVRGVPTSQHTLAQAIDFTPQTMNIDEAFKKIQTSGLTFDQLIKEHDKAGNVWIHISLRVFNNRQQTIQNLLKDNK